MKTSLIKLLVLSCLLFLGVKKADAATSITTSETGITNSGTNVPYGQTAAVFGFSIVTNTTTADLSTVSFTTANGYLNDLPAAGIRLVSSSTANYTTSTTLATVPATLVTTGTTLTFTITTPTGQVISTAPTKYYFLVVTFNGTAVLTLPDNFTFTLSTVTSITPTLTTNPNRAGTQYNFVAATLTQAQTTGGLPPGTTITGIQTNVALLGLSLTSTGTSSFSTLTFATTQNISTYFTTGNVNLYSSTSNIFSIGTATKLASTPVTATKVITFTGLAQTITNGATMYYYIVMDNYSPPAVSATFAVNLTTITPPNNNTVVTYGDQTGTVYTLSPISITEAQITAGLASTTQTASQNNLGVFGMSLTANGNTSFTGLKFGTTSTLPAGSNISTYFSSALIYTSSSSTFDGTATAVAGATYTTLAATTLTVTLPTQTINDGAANAKYYYLVVNYTQPLTSATYQFTLTNITGGPATTTIGSGAGQVYNLNAPTITENQTPGGGLYAPTNIIGNQTNLALSGISLVSANGNSTATVINYTATQNISTYFTGNVNFYESNSNTFSAGTATLITSTPVPASKNISFNIPAAYQSITSTPVYFYLVMDSYTPPTATATFEFDVSTVTTGNAITYTDKTGTLYTLTAPSLTENQTPGGGLYAPTNIIGNQTNLALSGISLVSANGNSTATVINYTATKIISTYFTGNVNFYVSASNTFSMGTATLLTSTPVPATTTISFNIPVAYQTVTSTPVYFYLVMDSYTPPTTTTTFEFDVSTITTAYPITYTDKTGTSYTLTAPSLTENQTPGAGLYTPTTITGSQTNLALSGISLVSANGNSVATTINYTATQPISTYFSGNVNFYESSSSTFSIGTATKITSTAVPASPNISFAIPAAYQTVTSTPIYFYLVMDANVPPPASTTFEFDVSTIATAYAITYTDKTGTPYTLTPAVAIGTATTTGLAANPLNYSQTGIGIYGFSVTTTASESFTSFNFTSTQSAGNIGTYFANVKIYANTTNTFTNSPANQVTATVTPATLNSTNLTLTFATAQTVVPGTPMYYFIVADFTDPTTAATFQLNVKNVVTATTTYTNGTPVAGTVYNVGPATNNWVGGAAGNTTNWNTAANWSYNAVPLPADNVQIGYNTTYNTNYNPVISSPVTVATISFGSNGGTNSPVNLTVNSTLNVTGDITAESDNNDNIAANQTVNLLGTGTINAVDLNVSDNFTSAFNLVTVNSSVINLNLSGNIALTTNGFLFFNVNSTFNLTGGTATVGGMLKSTNNVLIVGAPTSTFEVYNATLKLTNAAALSGLSGNGANVVTFTNTLAIVNYSGAAQTIYTTAAITGLAGGVTYNNLTLSGTGAKTPNVGNLSMIGNFTNSLTNDVNNYATLTSTPVYFDGTTQSMAGGLGTGTTFNHVYFSGAGIKTIASGYFNVASTGLLTITGAGSTQLNASGGGLLTLISDANNSASVAAISGPSISGNVNVQRYLTGGNVNYRGYRLLSSPVNISSSVAGAGYLGLSYMNTDVTAPATAYGALTAGPGGVGSGFTIDNTNPIIYLYNESLATNNRSFTGGKDVGVVAVTATGVSTLSAGVTGTATIPVGNGYFFYFIGNDQSTVTSASRVPENTTMTATGYLNQGNVSVRLWNTGSTSLSYASPAAPVGYNLVGNPYTSTIDLKLVYSDNGSKYPIFAMLNDVNPNQAFGYYNASTGAKSGTTTVASEYIASGQGFFVQATATGQTLTFKETEKIYNTALLTGTSSPPGVLSLHQPQTPLADNVTAPTTTKVDAIVEPQNTLNGLHIRMQSDSLTYDETGIYFSSRWSDKYDINDAYIVTGFSPKIYVYSFTSDGVPAGINSMGDYSKGKRVRLYVNGTTNGVYTLKMTDLLNIDTTLFNIYVVDNLQKDSTDMVRNKTYSFSINTADTTTFGANRFVVAIERKSVPPYQLLAFTGEKVTRAVQLNWKTYNEGDYTGFVLQKMNAAAKIFLPIDSLQSDNAATYSYIDRYPVTGSNIYRLKQNDINGNITYSSTITINYNGLGVNGMFSVYPNPSRERITISVNSTNTNAPAIYQSKIYNTAGAVIGERNINNSSWTEDISGYKAGVYIIILNDNKGNLIGKSKFVKTD